jgi:hypothetical protein
MLDRIRAHDVLDMRVDDTAWSKWGYNDLRDARTWRDLRHVLKELSRGECKLSHAMARVFLEAAMLHCTTQRPWNQTLQDEFRRVCEVDRLRGVLLETTVLLTAAGDARAATEMLALCVETAESFDQLKHRRSGGK